MTSALIIAKRDAIVPARRSAPLRQAIRNLVFERAIVVRLKQQLDAEGFRIPIRIDGAGRSTGGGLFSRGHVYKLLSNPIYVGRIAHKGQNYDGLLPPTCRAGC